MLSTRISMGPIVIALAASAAGCKSTDPAPPGKAAPATSSAAAGEVKTTGATAETLSVHAHMAEHYTQAQAMKQAVIGGDLEAYRTAARWLAEHQLSGTAPDPWRTHAAAMQEAARAGRDAQDVASAAAALGRVGQACAQCHDQLGVPKVAIGELPAAGSGTQPHMLRHQWAADRLWDGLMAPSDAAWVKGAEAMAEAPLADEQIAPGQSVSAEISKLATEVHSLANVARTVPADQRADAYGKLVLSCSGCHAKLAPKVK